jgi:hypothetical protein
MSQAALSFAVLYGLVLAGLAASLLAVFLAYRLVRGAEQRSAAARAECNLALESMRKEASVQAIPKPGLNLSKRSQALRMRRRGESTAQIAASLDVPRQEIDLLLKVHEIVIASI